MLEKLGALRSRIRPVSENVLSSKPQQGSNLETFLLLINKLKTTPTPNKNGSYGIKGGGGFVCHKSRSSYAVKVGWCTTFSVKVPLFQGIFTPYDPSFYGIFWGHIFANMGGGGGQNYFQLKPLAMWLGESSGRRGILYSLRGNRDPYRRAPQDTRRDSRGGLGELL